MLRSVEDLFLMGGYVRTKTASGRTPLITKGVRPDGICVWMNTILHRSPLNYIFVFFLFTEFLRADYGRQLLEQEGQRTNPKRQCCGANEFPLNVMADGVQGLLSE